MRRQPVMVGPMEWPSKPEDPGAEIESTPPPKPSETDYDKLADAITERLAKDPRFRGPAGQPGVKGDKGDKGEPGAVPEIDYDKIASSVVDKLPPIQVEILGRDGAVVKSEFVRLGGRLQLEPIYFEQYDIAGQKLDGDTIPLGGTLRIQEVVSERRVK
jgi:hypothetical protein